MNPSLFGAKLPYDTRRELLPVFLAMVTPNTLMVTNSSGRRRVPELIAHAKANPGKLDCASTGIGTVQHVSLELLNHRAGIQINHVVYREIAAARNDLTSGRVPLQFSNVPSTLPIIQANQARCLAHCGPRADRPAARHARLRRDPARLRDLGMERRLRPGRHPGRLIEHAQYRISTR